MATREESIQNLTAAKEYLAGGKWTTGIGYAEHDLPHDDPKQGQTCAIGSLAMAFGWTLKDDTDNAVEWLIDNDGEALLALAKSVPVRTDFEKNETRTPYETACEEYIRNFWIQEDDDLPLEVCGGLVYRFNDRQFHMGPVIKLFEDAIALMQA